MLENYKLLNIGDVAEQFNSVLAAEKVKTACSRGMDDKKWQHLKLKNVTVFAVSLKNIPMGCINVVLPDLFVIEQFIHCVTCNQSTTVFKSDTFCFSKSLAILLHGDERLEKRTCNFFLLFMKEKRNAKSATFFQGECMNDIQTAQDSFGINFILFDVDIVEGSYMGDLF